jgi:FtsZ-binding cell division protein ZapB
LKEAIEEKSKDALDQISDLTAHIYQLNQHLGQVDTEIQQAHSQIQQLCLDLDAMHASHSWRITQPLRWLGRFLRRISGKG